MASFLALIGPLLSLTKWFISIMTKWQLKREARREVAGEIAIQEVQAANDVAEVMAQPRSADDVADRMRDGKF